MQLHIAACTLNELVLHQIAAVQVELQRHGVHIGEVVGLRRILLIDGLGEGHGHNAVHGDLRGIEDGGSLIANADRDFTGIEAALLVAGLLISLRISRLVEVLSPQAAAGLQQFLIHGFHNLLGGLPGDLDAVLRQFRLDAVNDLLDRGLH